MEEKTYDDAKEKKKSDTNISNIAYINNDSNNIFNIIYDDRYV